MKKVLLMLAIAGVVAACAIDEEQWLPNPEGYYTSPSNPSIEQVRNALQECGYSRPLKVIGYESLDNVSARITECMFARGFYFKTGYGGHCSQPNYRAELPACKTAPLRPVDGYYGK